MPLKCIIVDDEPIAQNIVKGFISDTPNLDLIQICHNAMEAMPILQQQAVDLIFLDIEMPKISGLSFLKTLVSPPAIIITSAYREFALEGYELNVIDYLLKPFSFERFLKAVNKVDSGSNVQAVSDNNPVVHRPFDYFKADKRHVKVYFDEILYIEGLSNYVRIILNDDQLVVYISLLELEKKLPKKQFARIHKSHIVSLDKIRAYGSDYVELGNKQLSIGNTYKKAFFELIGLVP